jgi:hypothetical protein
VYPRVRVDNISTLPDAHHCPLQFAPTRNWDDEPSQDKPHHRGDSVRREGGALECGSLLPLSVRPACWPYTGARYSRR